MEQTKKKSILFISQYFLPDITAVSFRIYNLSKFLVKDGYTIHILTAKPHKLFMEKETPPLPEGVKVFISPILPLKIGSSLSYILHYLSFTFFSFIVGIIRSKSRYNFVISSSPPLFTGLVGIFLSKIKRAKFIIDIRDIWPDSAVDTGHIKKNSIVYHLGKILEFYLYNKAEGIICVSKRMKNWVKKQLIKEKKMEVIYNSVDTEILPSVKKTVIKRKFDKKNPFRILYVGNIGYAQGIEILLDAASEIKNKPIKFIIIGGGALRRKLENRVIEESICNVELKGPFEKKTIYNLMLNADALFVHLIKKPAFSITIPSKIFEYLFANKPIIYGIQGEGKEILDNLKGNIYFEPENRGMLKEVILNLFNNYKKYSENTLKNKNYLYKHFTSQKMKQRLKHFLEKTT